VRNETTPALRVHSVADPGRLGLPGFARTTFVLSAVNAGWIPKHGEPVVLGLAFACGAFDSREEGIACPTTKRSAKEIAQLVLSGESVGESPSFYSS